MNIDHTGILTRDLDALERWFEALGFVLSPRSRHRLALRPGEETVPGNTANRCAVFADSFIELLGIVDPSAPDPWGVNGVPDGFRIFYVRSGDLEADERRLRDEGVPTLGIRSLERPVDTPDGTRTLRASALHVDPKATPEGFLGIARHLTPEYLHQPRYLDHPNGALRVSGLTVMVDEPELDAYADRYARIIGVPARAEGADRVLNLPDGHVRLVASSGRSHFAGMTVRVRDVEAARTLVDGNGVPTRTAGQGFTVTGFGADVTFVQ
ncbi:VOC family protein [Actinomadura fibrosa]|uniref:VOC family protein n=1 Tax=Actinomadura fibrosa TaxID=111802 RepID=A0ABW2XMT2_9ACTN|nr:VOC family protein [Actinomadura fibrosa]